MSMQDHQELSSPNASSNVSKIRAYPSVSNGDVLEDGEIMERHLSSIASQSLSQQPQLQLSNQVIPSTPPFPPSEPIPNLALTAEPMSKEDLDRAKSLVLDLLGWGVTPEYLVDCGLSPSVVYKIFTDLRLRLPSNLEALSPPPSHHGAR